MNNQVKLIDQTKLLEDLKGRKRVLRDGLNFAKREGETVWADQIREQMQILTELIECVEEGTYATDTPPVPTIKPGDKVRHEMHGYGTAHGVFEVSKNVLVAFNKFQHAVIVPAEDLEVVE